MTCHQEFKELSDQIGLVNGYLAAQLNVMQEDQRRPIDRVNDAALIVFHVFAFEDFCLRYVQDKKYRDTGPPYDAVGSNLLKNLMKAIKCPHKLAALAPALKTVDEIMMIRDLYAHRLGRREGLCVGTRLLPEVLKKYGFETDGCQNDLSVRWWPTRFCSFSACVSPLVKMAEWINANLTPNP